MARKPAEASDESIHADATPEPYVMSLILYVTDVDNSTCQRWGNPADCPQGRVTTQPGVYITAEAPTTQHPCPGEPEAFLSVRTIDPTIFAGAPLVIGTQITVKATFSVAPPPSPLKADQKLPPARPRPLPGAPI
jgi:hypothetical protein